MMIPSDEGKVKKIFSELKKIYTNYKKRKTKVSKETLYVLEYLIAEYEAAIISFDMRGKSSK